MIIYLLLLLALSASGFVVKEVQLATPLCDTSDGRALKCTAHEINLKSNQVEVVHRITVGDEHYSFSIHRDSTHALLSGQSPDTRLWFLSVTDLPTNQIRGVVAICAAATVIGVCPSRTEGRVARSTALYNGVQGCAKKPLGGDKFRLESPEPNTRITICNQVFNLGCSILDNPEQCGFNEDYGYFRVIENPVLRQNECPLDCTSQPLNNEEFLRKPFSILNMVGLALLSGMFFMSLLHPKWFSKWPRIATTRKWRQDGKMSEGWVWTAHVDTALAVMTPVMLIVVFALVVSSMAVLQTVDAYEFPFTPEGVMAEYARDDGRPTVIRFSDACGGFEISSTLECTVVSPVPGRHPLYLDAACLSDFLGNETRAPSRRKGSKIVSAQLDCGQVFGGFVDGAATLLAVVPDGPIHGIRVPINMPLFVTDGAPQTCYPTPKHESVPLARVMTISLNLGLAMRIFVTLGRPTRENWTLKDCCTANRSSVVPCGSATEYHYLKGVVPMRIPNRDRETVSTTRIGSQVRALRQGAVAQISLPGGGGAIPSPAGAILDPLLDLLNKFGDAFAPVVALASQLTSLLDKIGPQIIDAMSMFARFSVTLGRWIAIYAGAPVQFVITCLQAAMWIVVPAPFWPQYGVGLMSEVANSFFTIATSGTYEPMREFYYSVFLGSYERVMTDDLAEGDYSQFGILMIGLGAFFAASAFAWNLTGKIFPEYMRRFYRIAFLSYIMPSASILALTVPMAVDRCNALLVMVCSLSCMLGGGAGVMMWCFFWLGVSDHFGFASELLSVIMIALNAVILVAAIPALICVAYRVVLGVGIFKMTPRDSFSPPDILVGMLKVSMLLSEAFGFTGGRESVPGQTNNGASPFGLSGSVMLDARLNGVSYNELIGAIRAREPAPLASPIDTSKACTITPVRARKTSFNV